MHDQEVESCGFLHVDCSAPYLSLIPGRGGGVTAPIHSRNSQRCRGSVLNTPPSQMSSGLVMSRTPEHQVLCHLVSAVAV